MSNMYENAKTWNPFKGCGFDCAYCVPTFQRQSKRWGKGNCKPCYDFTPHFHEERLDRIPSSEIVFVCGSGDISWAEEGDVVRIIDRIKEHNKRCPEKTYYFQSKCPSYFENMIDLLPDNAVILTTLETDKSIYSDGSKYEDYSMATTPWNRMVDFWKLDYLRKGITIEPVMEFSNIFTKRIILMDPEFVYIGFNTQPEAVRLPEPSDDDVVRLITELREAGIDVRTKDMRDVNL